ncbi:MAG: glutathione S-transferase family protein [Pseudomonadota bacterium]
MNDCYTLYGSHASYYTAKVRAYLRKKNIPFVERLPSDPAFRNRVRPTSGSHRIPQLLTPQGQVIQDSVEILDYLEARFPDIPAIPSTPNQRTFVHLLELLASEGLVQLAWMHRWLFPENLHFVTMEFGRSFRPQGRDEELLKYGNLIAERMKSYGLPNSNKALLENLDRQYQTLLSLFEAHLVEQPYLLGGQPSAADYAFMGALHAHMGRDPAGLRVLQNHGPRTFRWIEHMLVPEIESPEFFDRPVELLALDHIPQTALAILRWLGKHYGKSFVLGALAFNQIMQRQQPSPGHVLAPDEDQPTLDPETVRYANAEQLHSTNLHAEWVSQRARRYFQTLDAGDQQHISALICEGPALDLLKVPVLFPIARAHNRLVIEQAP